MRKKTAPSRALRTLLSLAILACSVRADELISQTGRAVKKCCPMGKMLQYQNETGICRSAKTKYEMLYQFGHGRNVGLPVCEKHEKKPYEFKHASNQYFDGTDGCIEKTFTNNLTKQRKKLSVLKCNSADKNARINFSNLVIKNIKKCCPFDEVFDMARNSCQKLDIGEETVAPINLTWTDNTPIDYLQFYYAPDSNFFKKCYYEEIDDSNGSLDVKLSYTNDSPNNFNSICMDSNVDGKFILGYCQCKDNKMCLSKCCGPDHYLYFPACVKKPYDIIQNISQTIELSHKYKSGVRRVRYDYTHGCPYAAYKLSKRNLIESETGEFTLADTLTPLTYENSCYELVKKGKEVTYDIYVCLEKPIYNTAITKTLTCLSAVCLLVTLIIYSYLPFLRKRHGKCTVCELSAYCLAFTLTTVTRVYYVEGTTFGLFIGYCSYYFFLCTRSWLNVMSYDVWKALCEAFRSRRSNRTVPNNEPEKLIEITMCNKTLRFDKFIRYSIFAWCFPLVIVIVMIICEYSESIPIHYRPNMVKEASWFSEIALIKYEQQFAVKSHGETLYYRIPIALSLLTSLFLLISTTAMYTEIMLKERKRFGNAYNPNIINLKTYKSQVIMNWRLFIAVSVPVLAKTIKQFMESFEFQYNWSYEIVNQSAFLWSAEGIFIFVVFVLVNPKVMETLLKMRRELSRNLFRNYKRDARPQDPEDFALSRMR